MRRLNLILPHRLLLVLPGRVQQLSIWQIDRRHDHLRLVWTNDEAERLILARFLGRSDTLDDCVERKSLWEGPRYQRLPSLRRLSHRAHGSLLVRCLASFIGRDPGRGTVACNGELLMRAAIKVDVVGLQVRVVAFALAETRLLHLLLLHLSILVWVASCFVDLTRNLAVIVG